MDTIKAIFFGWLLLMAATAVGAAIVVLLPWIIGFLIGFGIWTGFMAILKGGKWP